MKQTLLTLITTLVFAGACAYLLQKVRGLENRLVRVRQLTLQRMGAEDVHKIAKTLITQRERHLKLQTTLQQQSQQPQQPQKQAQYQDQDQPQSDVGPTEP